MSKLMLVYASVIIAKYLVICHESERDYRSGVKYCHGCYTESKDKYATLVKSSEKSLESIEKISKVNRNVSSNRFKRAGKQIKVLMWPHSYWGPDVVDVIQGQSSTRFCKIDNCVYHLTEDYNAFKRYDAIMFSEFFGHEKKLPRLPRSLKQKYIYLFREPSNSWPMLSSVFDNFFNWTMSYRLTSDILFPYINIYDNTGKLVGPAENIKWRENMRPISNSLKQRLKTKTRLAAIFVSNCNVRSERLTLVKKIQKSLHRYNATIDIIGGCGDKSCPRDEQKRCLRLLKQDYFFYLSFENSFAIDYVTEKLLRAVKTYTVPIVYGGADYSRFLPKGSYINACNVHPDVLAKHMVEVSQNWTKYFDYFRFRNYYTVVDSLFLQRFMCDLCEALNNKTLLGTQTSYEKFSEWHDMDTNRDCYN